VGRELREGLQFVRTAPSLSTLFFIGTMTMIGEGFFMTLMVPFVVKVMKGTEADFGYLMTAQAIGGIIGSLFVARIAKNIPAHRLFGFCAIIFGICDLVLFYSPLVVTGVTPGLVIIAIVGVPAVGIGTGLTTLLQKLTVDSYRGRVFGVYGTLVALLGLIGAAIAGVLGEHINLMVLLTIQGLVYVVAGALALMLLQRTAQPVGAVTPVVEVG
jgi:predicted MFS family arabinose efflux permease